MTSLCIDWFDLTFLTNVTNINSHVQAGLTRSKPLDICESCSFFKQQQLLFVLCCYCSALNWMAQPLVGSKSRVGGIGKVLETPMTSPKTTSRRQHLQATPPASPKSRNPGRSSAVAPVLVAAAVSHHHQFPQAPPPPTLVMESIKPESACMGVKKPKQAKPPQPQQPPLVVPQPTAIATPLVLATTLHQPNKPCTLTSPPQRPNNRPPPRYSSGKEALG